MVGTCEDKQTNGQLASIKKAKAQKVRILVVQDATIPPRIGVLEFD
jgi:hypothetical protein